MRIVLQRVKRASVKVSGEIVGEIESGLLVLLGISKADAPQDADYLVEKTISLRIFEDEAGKMNINVRDAGGSILVVSQFTLYGDCRKGRRPSFDAAAPPAAAEKLYEYFVAAVRTHGLPVATGIFQADMQVELVNDGPVTLILDSEKLI